MAGAGHVRQHPPVADRQLVFSAYLMLGSRLRARLPLAAYIWLALAGLALGPQLLGHTAYNWSLRYVSATFIAVVTLGEPVGSALMAFIFFGEGFTPLQFVGFALLLLGIYLAAQDARKAG